MLEFIDLGTEQVIGIRIDGTVTAAAFDELLTVVQDRTSRFDKLRLYAELHSIEGAPVEALLKDTKLGFGNREHFDKEAVVMDQPRMETSAGTVENSFPGIELRTFPLAEAQAARRWVVS